jgi:hypothetical protein
MTRYRRRGGANEPSMTKDECAAAYPAAAAADPAVQGFAGVGAPGVADEDEDMNGGRRRRHSRRHRHHRHRKTLRAVPKGVHVKAKTLKKLLKSRGLKVSGKKATLRARARKAHLIRGGSTTTVQSSGPAAV